MTALLSDRRRLSHRGAYPIAESWPMAAVARAPGGDQGSDGRGLEPEASTLAPAPGTDTTGR